MARKHGFENVAIPPIFYTMREPFFHLHRRHALWPQICGPGKAAEQDEVRDAVGIGGSEQRAHASAFRKGQDRRSARADLIDDGADIVHSLFQGRCTGHPVRQTLSSLVERDDPGEPCQSLQRGRISGQLVEHLDVGRQSRNQDDVDGAITQHLIGDVNVPALRVPCFWRCKVRHVLLLVIVGIVAWHCLRDQEGSLGVRVHVLVRELLECIEGKSREPKRGHGIVYRTGPKTIESQ